MTKVAIDKPVLNWNYNPSDRPISLKERFKSMAELLEKYENGEYPQSYEEAYILPSWAIGLFLSTTPTDKD